MLYHNFYEGFDWCGILCLSSIKVYMRDTGIKCPLFYLACRGHDVFKEIQLQSCCLVEIFRVKQHLSNFSFFSEKHIDLGIFEEFIIEIYRNTCFNFQNNNFFINSFEQFF